MWSAIPRYAMSRVSTSCGKGGLEGGVEAGAGGKPKKQSKKDDGQRVLRGGSFVDSLDGSFNHVVMVSTRQTNAADSAGRVCVGQLNNSTTLLYDRIALLMIYLLDNSYRLYRSFLSPSNLPTT